MQSNNSSKTEIYFRFLHLDLILFGLVILLILVGLVIFYSAANQSIDSLNKQLLRVIFAIFVMIFIAQIRPFVIERWSTVIFFAGLCLLFYLHFYGVGKGAQRWIEIFGFRFQPSEFMKLFIAMFIAKYLEDKPSPPDFKTVLVSIALVFLPVILVAMQPDLGTSILVGLSGLVVLFFAGIKAKLISFFTFIVVIPLGILYWFFGLLDYQKARIISLLNPEDDKLGASYQIIQSKIAIGSGGIYGKGWLNGTQSHLEFLPERSTDFIFAVFAEEFGFLGTSMLMLLYLLIILRIFYIASVTQTHFGRLFVSAIAVILLLHIFVNIGMVSGILPVVGVPLPLVSFGGSSMLVFMSAFGIIMSIHTHRSLLRNS
jgi:rod shape determining protein RodA